MTWTHRCMIVPAAHVEFARQLPAAIAGPSGSGMWGTPLSPSGKLPATHWISSGLIDKQFADLLPLMQYPADAEPIYTPGRPGIAAHLATAAGFTATADQVQALFDASDATDQEATVAMSRLGLMMAFEQETPDVATDI
jgi:hypothetical protein